MTTPALLMIMDPLGSIHPEKDTNFALLLHAQARGWLTYYCSIEGLTWRENAGYAAATLVHSLRDTSTQYYQEGATENLALAHFDTIFMRKDPPVNAPYWHATQLLSLAQRQGARVINDPQGLREANEKLFAHWFPDYCPPSVITAQHAILMDFLNTHKRIVCKPLDGMGGAGVFAITEGDMNTGVIFETLTAGESTPIVAQRYLPEILTKGDKRILMINGEPVSHGLSRMPAAGEFRGNLASGGTGIVSPLSDEEYALCAALGPTLREKGLYFVGIDVIGGYLTEINVTSPTCVRQIESATGLNICQQVFDQLPAHHPRG